MLGGHLVPNPEAMRKVQRFLRTHPGVTARVNVIPARVVVTFTWPDRANTQFADDLSVLNMELRGRAEVQSVPPELMPGGVDILPTGAT